MTHTEQSGRPGGERPEHGWRGDVTVCALDRLADRDEGFREDRPELGDERWSAFDEHRRHLSELRGALAEVGLSADEMQLFDRFYGFQKDGREPITEIERAHGRTTKQIGDFIRDVSTRLAAAGWRLPAG